MFSCDTMAVCAAYSKYGQNILAKNSDRPTGEPQPLCFYAGQEYEESTLLQTTYLVIPQVQKTYSVVGSRPYWIWGFEMGFNEKGLMIGNEAEGSRMEPDTENGLLGMDLLRLGLERAATAKEAITVITDLLKRYGQRAVASALTNRTYENTFILVDPKEAWVLETAGREWVAKQIKTMQGVSNCYSITTDVDLASEDAEKIARDKRWLAPDAPFDFAGAYTGRLVNQPLGVQRFRRLNKLLQKSEIHDFDSLAAILRDHHEDELISPRFGATAGTFLSICMHMRDWGESESAASLLARYDEDLGVIARYAPSQPCLSAYIPVYLMKNLPKDFSESLSSSLPASFSADSPETLLVGLPAKIQTAARAYSADSLWWQLKELCLLVTVDEERFAPDIRQELKQLEAGFANKAETAEKQAKGFLSSGRTKEALTILNTVTEECTESLFAYAREKNTFLRNLIHERGGVYGRQKEAIEKYLDYAGISHF